MLELIQTHHFAANNARHPAKPDSIRRIEISLSYMLQNLDKPIHISTLGKLAGVSTSYFSYLFKCATGDSPNHFLIRVRMRRGCELLRETDLSVKEVAGLLGYLDPLYFSRVFKLVIGIPPTKYRVMTSGSDNIERHR